MTEKLIQRLHAQVEHGVRARPDPVGHGLIFYRRVIGNSSEVYRQWVLGDHPLSRMLSHKPKNVSAPN